MTNEIEIDGTQYVLAAAVPYITNGFFSLTDLFRILAEQGDYFTASGHPLDVSLCYAENDGTLVEVPHEVLKRAATESSGDAGPPGWVSNLAEVAVVNSDALEEVFRIHLASNLAKPTLSRRDVLGVAWNINAAVPRVTKEKLTRFRRAKERRLVPRKGSKALKQKAVASAVEILIQRISSVQPAFDRLKIPGGAEPFVRLLKHVDPSLSDLATATLTKSYFTDLNIGFKEGRKTLARPDYINAYEELTRPPR